MVLVYPEVLYQLFSKNYYYQRKLYVILKYTDIYHVII